MGNSLHVLLLIVSSFFPGDKGKWELEKDKNGLAVYTRHVPGKGLKELRAMTTFNSNLSGIVALIRDIPEAKNYVFHCTNAYIVSANEAELVYYQDVSVQWPVQNRDVVIRYTFKQDPKTKVVTVESSNVTGVIKEFEGKVRIPEMRGMWRFTPRADGKVDGEYTLFVDPGGNIPESVANMFMVDGPYETILKMKTLVTQPKYQTKKFKTIVN